MTHDLAASVVWASVPTVIFVILSALILIASAVAVVRASYAKTQIEALRGDRDDLTARLVEARSESAVCRTEVDKLRGELQVEAQRREALEQVVTAKKELETVISILNAHDHRAAGIENMMKKLLDRSDKQARNNP